ncbi:MAG TPA: Hpt domain-containing protein [Methylophilaceae bacterium]|jgi:HPt (histidine-containing phosphotransfer) domain-containing protein
MENSSTPTSAEVIDFGRLKELFGNDDAIIQKLFDTFVTTTPPLLAQLDTAIADADFMTIKALGHQIAGSAANLGAQRMHLLAREIENEAHGPANGRCHVLFDDLTVAFIEVCDVVSSTK